MKKTMALVLAAVLLLGATALAAGLVFTDHVDAKVAAQEALAAQYGFTPEMEAFFDCEVSEDERSVVFTPRTDTGAGVGERLGVYTVTLDKGGKATASWSHDGKTVGETLQSPVWNAKLLGEALARKTAGEEWIEIVLGEEQTAVTVTEAEAVEIARKAVASQFGLDAQTLAINDDWGVHLFIRSVSDAQADGKGARCYQVRFEENGDMAYSVCLYANDGEVFETVDMRADQDAETAQVFGDEADPHSEQAQALAALSVEEAVTLARDAAAQVYGLSEAQKAAMEWVEDVYPSAYAMAGETPVIRVYLWLWEGDDGAAFSEGDGVYVVEVNAQSGAIESISYDSTLGNNG